MKKFKFYSFASALMLASAVGLGSCSSESDVNGGGTAGDEIKTEFAINIPRAAKNGSRATADQVQGEGKTFLGMSNIWLLAFNSTPSDETSWTKPLQLPNIETQEISNSQSSKLYKNIPVSTGTSNFMLYGFAPNADPKLGAFEEELDLDGGNRTTPSNISFHLRPIIDNSVDLTSGAPCHIVKALNDLLAIDWGEEDPFASMKSNIKSLKAGSSRSVCALFQEIYDYAIKPYSETQPTLTKKIEDAITSNGFTISDGKVSTTKQTENFPGYLGLPDGAFSLELQNGTDGQNDRFSYSEWRESNLTGIMRISPTSITYPARLSYFVNTPIHTSSTEITSANWPQTTDKWTDETFKNANWKTNSKVDETTVAIALAKNINYCVANLRTRVKCSASELSDNGDGTVKVKVPDEGLKVTGILIGNQPDEVDYLFNPVVPGKVDHFTQTIWDSQVSNIMAKAGDYSAYNYTTVLPNKIDGTEQKEVNIAIEFENNTNQPFKGNDGIIEAGARFYLLGTLKPVAKTQEGVSTVPDVTNPSVFMQDYQTTANFTISSLKAAYNTIPDIRTTNMQLGLSVDLEWEKGYTFDVTIGGTDSK